MHRRRTRYGTRSAMTGLLTRARFILGAVAIAGFIAVAAPAHAQQSAPVDPDASVVNEQTLLREAPRIEGLIDQPDGRARVLVQPAGRMWDHFHEVTLHWLGAIIILGMIAALGAPPIVLGGARVFQGPCGGEGSRLN